MASLDPFEIQLIKGLAVHCRLSASEIQAYFSRPDRPIRESLIAAIVQRRAATSETVYPTATPAMCQRFRATWRDRENWHMFARLRASGIVLRRSPMEFAFGYRYHPVGQGGFCSGWFTRRDQSIFHYVYDCGTEHGSKPTPRARVKREIDALADEIVAPTGQPLALDLVTLSHFDEDHLSGLTDLVSKFRVERLLLPHLSPWRRLCIALDKRVALGSALIEFVEAPTAFLQERFGDRIGEIILIGPGDDVPDGPAVPSDEPPPEEIEPSGVLDKIPTDDAIPHEHDDGAGADGGLGHPRVKLLRAGAAITIDWLWEFVPYNDQRLAGAVTDAFKAKARPLLAQVRDKSLDEETRAEALRDLQAHYDETFRSRKGDPQRARRRNEISLFLYSGPVGRVELLDHEEYIVRHGLPSIRCWSPGTSRIREDRFGQMFTGDGYLFDDAEWDAFRAYYEPARRLCRAGLFQVPHHGSHKNWAPGRAILLKPAVSLFCSNPTGTHGHPRPEVIDDFRLWNPQQVDSTTGWELLGWFGFKY